MYSTGVLCASAPEYEAIRQKINVAAYETFRLSEADFNDPVFMEAADFPALPTSLKTHENSGNYGEF